MRAAAADLEFEEAARLRDELKRLRQMELAIADDPFARQSELAQERSSSAGRDSAYEDLRSASAERDGAYKQDPLNRPHKPTLDEMGPHNREIPLASIEKHRGRSKAGKPGAYGKKRG